MGYQTKIQSIKRANSEQWYVILPAQVAQAMEFEPSETVEWFIDEDKSTLALKRINTPDLILKKNDDNRHFQRDIRKDTRCIQTRTSISKGSRTGYSCNFGTRKAYCHWHDICGRKAISRLVGYISYV